MSESIDIRSKSADEIFCRSCGAVIKKEAEICPKCGVRQIQTGLTQKSRITAALLAILFGGIGIHKFYIGKSGQGIIYLIFFWTVIPMIVGFIEGIFYLVNTKTDEEFTAKYCS